MSLQSTEAGSISFRPVDESVIDKTFPEPKQTRQPTAAEAGLASLERLEAKRNIRHHRALAAIMETRRDEGADDFRPSDMPRLYKLIAILDEVADEV